MDATAQMKRLRELPESIPRDKDRLLPLVAEPVNENSSVLIFCSSRAQTQSTATFVADHLASLLKDAWSTDIFARRHELLERLRLKLGGIASKLPHLIEEGTYLVTSSFLHEKESKGQEFKRGTFQKGTGRHTRLPAKDL